MTRNEVSLFHKKALPMLILFALGTLVGLNLTSCGADEAGTDENQLTQEEQRDLARFVEYMFFPTAPYVDKSWIEKVPEEEVIKKPIDFAAETAAIQQIYTEIYHAWEARDFKTVAENFYPSTIRFVFLCAALEHPVGVAPIRLLSKNSLIRNILQCNRGWARLSSTSLLTEFYIRRKNVQAPWPEASAKTADNTYIYLTKRGERWYLNELVVTTWYGRVVTTKGDTRKYFDDPKYKAP